MGLRVLKVWKPFMAALPEVEAPDRKVAFNYRLVYTIVALIGYLIMSQVPLYGIQSSEASDPLYSVRVLTAARRGTLMELGVLPILTSGMIMQFLASTNTIHVDYSLKEDRALFCGAQKLFAIGIAFSQAALLVFTGLYGDANDIGMVKCGLLVLQIGLSSVVTLLFDEILQKGYGIGSGINLFVAANVAQTIFWNLLSLSTVPTVRGNEYEGALISLFQLVMSRSDKSRALKDAFYRTDLPNFMSVVATVVIFCAAAYLQGLRIELPVKSNRLRSQQAKYPIKLLYTSCMPIMLQSAMFANILFVSQILYVYFGSNFLVRVLGVWEPLGETNQLFATGGVAYYLSPPRGFLDAVISPFHTFVYTSIVITTCAFLSKIWMEISGSSTRDVAKQLKDQQLTISGFRDVSMHKELKRVIPIAASFGGAVLAVISVFGDVVGAIGTGAGVLMCVIIIFQYFEMFVQEQMEGNMTMESMMAGAQ